MFAFAHLMFAIAVFTMYSVPVLEADYLEKREIYLALQGEATEDEPAPVIEEEESWEEESWE